MVKRLNGNSESTTQSKKRPYVDAEYLPSEKLEHKNLGATLCSPKVIVEIFVLFFTYLNNHRIWGPLFLTLIATLVLIFGLLWRAEDVVTIITVLKD